MRFWKLKKDDDINKDSVQDASSVPEAEEAVSAAAEETSAADEAAKESATQPEKEPVAAEPDWKDQYVRLMADFDNFKKRTARDREDTYRYAEADILKDLLPTVDNLALALGNAKDPDDDFVKGVRLVYDTFLKALKDHGAEPFDSVGLELDPEKMEAIATLPSPDYEEGKVSTEVKRGWMLKEKLLRAAQVVVSSGKSNG